MRSGQPCSLWANYAAARTHLEQGIALTDPTTQRALALRYGEAPGVRCLALAANTLWCLGYPDPGHAAQSGGAGPGAGLGPSL